MQCDACVYTARDEAELERLRRGLGLDGVVVCERTKQRLASK